MEDSIIEFSKKFDKFPTDTQCPICGRKYKFHISYVQVPCDKCGTTYRTDFNLDIYSKKAKQIMQKFAWNDKVTFKADESYEAELLQVKRHYEMHGCYEVSDITKTIEQQRRCKRCGICQECFTCSKCGKTFKKDRNKRKQTCPHCKSNDYVHSYFKEVLEFEDNKNIKLCPHCKSPNIVMTQSKLSTKCHLCGSKSLAEPIIKTVFWLTVERKQPYKRERLGYED